MGVGGLEDGGVADGRELALRTQLIDAAGSLSQRIALPGPDAVTMQARTVGSEESTGLVLDDAVGEELHRVRRQQR